MTPKSASRSATRYAAAGVGSIPASYTSTPEAARPAEIAAPMNWPLIRESWAITALGRCPSATWSKPSTTAAA